jgi:hypothetical protein
MDVSIGEVPIHVSAGEPRGKVAGSGVLSAVYLDVRLFCYACAENHRDLQPYAGEHVSRLQH